MPATPPATLFGPNLKWNKADAYIVSNAPEIGASFTPDAQVHRSVRLVLISLARNTCSA